MSDAAPTVKEFAPGEVGFYEEFVDSNTADTLEGLDDVRPSLMMYPQAYHHTRDAFYELPYTGEGVTETKPNPKLDAFCARRIADIMFSFGRRINTVGFADDSPDIARFENVDLSAANDPPPPDATPEANDAAIRESYMGNRGITDEDVARHGDLGNQRAIDEAHSQSRDADAQIETGVADEVNEIIEELGGTMRVAARTDDGASQVEGEGGGNRVQTGMLYSSGSDLGGGICARNCARLLFKAVLDGTPTRPGLAQRLQVLTEYGVMTQPEIDLLVQKIQDEVDGF